MTNPRWLEPLPDAALMRATDEWAIETKGVPARQLMERAGEGLARAVGKHAPAGRIAIVCGKGNNGGDGLVAARLLRQAGRDVDVLAVWPPEWMGEDAQAQVKVLPGPAPVPFHPDRLQKAHAIVDAVLGTGFEGKPRDPADAVILAINSARARVIAADVPSGVNASTGEVEGSAVRALATATFHQAKPGLWISPGKEHAGIVETVDIGIPQGAPGEAEIGLIGGGVLFEMPRRTSGLDEVLLRQRLHPRRLARADRRPVDGRAGGDARRRGLRDGRRAPIPRALLHGEAAGGDDGRAARARRLADPDRAAARARGDRPRRRRRARPGDQQGARARRSSRASSSSASTSRSWSTRTGSTRSPAARWRSSCGSGRGRP